MGIFHFSIHMLKKELKKSVVYTFTLCMTIAVTFLFFNIIDNKNLLEVSDRLRLAHTGGMQIPFSSLLSFIVIIFCSFMIIFANNFYLSRKTKEIAIMTISGSSYFGVTGYLFVQNMIMTLVAFPLGIGVGSLLAMSMNQVIYQYIGYTGAFFYIPTNAIVDTLVCVVSIVVAQLIYASGYVFRHDVASLLSQETKNKSEDHRIFKLPSFFYIFLYVAGLVFLLMSEYTSTSAIFPCCIGVLGIGGIIKYDFPRLFKHLKTKRYLSNKLKLISLSNLFYSLNRAVVLVGLYAIASSVMIALLISQQDNPREFVTSIVGFIVVIVLLLVSIVYKYTLEASSRRVFYYNLYKLGYTYQHLVSIIKQEVIMFFIVLVGFPLVYILISLTLSLIHQDIRLLFYIIMILVQFIPAILACMLTFQSYKKSVLGVIEEGVRYE